MTMDTSELPPKNKTTPFFSGVLVAFFLLSLWSYTTHPSPPTIPSSTQTQTQTRTQTRLDPTTFYDDPSLSYTTDTPVHNWDEKRTQWLATNPSFSRSGSNRVVMVTGSQHGPCKNPVGDHLLLKLFKNKADYCRIHGYDLFYNNVLLDPKMPGYWAKYPVIRAAMLAHPEAEWIYWVDSDAAITDMDFSLPLEKYQDHNLVIHGWPNLVYDKRSWTGLNAGVFLIRNCQWSMDLLDRWTSFGPTSPDYIKWGSILKSIFPDKLYPESDDQTALGYLMVKEGKKWGDKIYLENEYYFEGYWVEIVGKLETVSKSYNEIERKVRKLRRMHGERGGEDYRAQWEAYFKENNGLRRPFITHFTGCDVCNGKHNPMYTGKKCLDGINKGLNFADNQVLRNYGFVHLDLYNSSSVRPLSFD
ncbi:putative glycosyltransferase 7 [Silene latifolia]|uniref:putative glycosyltransferase 7 n=1 Tax=Silene latifolia TaxID=37657 RepID=UPI003D774125